VTPQLVVTATTTGETAVARSVAEERFRATLSLCFSVAGLMLAAVGLYGLAARRAAARRREFGVRVALGAEPSNVRALVLRDALAIVAAGLFVGLPAAFGASQVTSALLFGVSASAPRVFASAAAVLALTAMAATILPARRASRQDPILALKE
jgi:putative ABC transport system permease protein